MGALYFFMVIVVILVIGLPICLFYVILKYLRHRNVDKRLRVLALLPLIVVGYFIYRAIYPPETFYKEDFKQVTGVAFPEAGEIEYKSASFPDQFGDYYSVSIVKVDKQFYHHLLERLPSQGFRATTEEDFGLAEYDQIMKKIGARTIESEYCSGNDKGVIYYVGFLSDKETCIVQRMSW